MKLIRFLRRETRKSKFIMLSIVCILLFVIIMTGNINKAYNGVLEYDNQYTNNAITLTFNDKLNSNDILHRISRIQENKNIIVRYGANIFDYDSNYIGDYNSDGIYFNDKFNNGYNLISGRFFNQNDFTQNKNMVVIGKDMVKYTVKKNGSQYLPNGNTMFQVIGIIGKKGLSTMYDDKILYNLDYVFKNPQLVYSDSWSIDSTTLTKQQLKNIVLNVDKSIQIGNSPILKRPNPLKDAVQMSQELIIIVVGILFCIFVTLIFSLYNWLDFIKLEIGIREYSGATKGNIILIVLRRYFIISFISFAMSIILYYLLHKLSFGGLFDYNINTVNILLSLLLIVIMGIITILISTDRISKVQISRLMRGV